MKKFQKGDRVKYGDLKGVVWYVSRDSVEVHLDQISGEKQAVALFDKNGYLLPIKEYVLNSTLEIINQGD